MAAFRFLLLETNPDFAQAVQATLRAGGIDCEVVWVDSRADFVGTLSTNTFDLILSDYALPDFDGMAALEVAHSLHPEIPFIFVCVSVGEEGVIAAFEAGASGFVLKQQLERLVPCVQRALCKVLEDHNRKRTELVQIEQQQLLELIATGCPLNDCLAAICASVSRLNPRVRACFLLADAQRLTFKRSIIPEFPPSLGQKLKDLPINDLCIGTCGEAVYWGIPISCADIANDDRWSQEWREVCMAYGILACHSQPVMGVDGLPLGSLMLCFDEARMPIPWEYQLADFGTHVASIVFERDRANLAQRESEKKYRSLFNLIDQGFCVLEMIYDEQAKPVDCLYTEANPVFSDVTGFPADVVGRTAREMEPDLEDFWFETYGHVAMTGKPVRFERYAAPLDRWFDVYAMRVGDAAQLRVGVLFTNISTRKRREANLTFLAQIQDDFARLTSANEMMQTVGEKLGTYLDISNCLFAEINEAQDTAIVEYVWHPDNTLDLTGVYQLTEFVTEEFRAMARAKQTIVICNTQTDSRTDAENYAALNIHAFITVPFHRNDEWKYLFTVNDATAREWRQDEIELIRELTSRIFPRLERARAEADLAEDLRDTQLLRELGERLVIEGDIKTLYQEIMAAAITLTRADAGTVQILDEATQELVLLATQGFERKMTEHFYRVNASSNTPCGIALITGKRTFVDFDVPESEDPDGSMRIHVEAGCLSAQSTPLRTRSGRPIGMVSTHWRKHHRPSDRELRFLDLLARQAADLIEQRQTEIALRDSEQRLRMASEASNLGLWFWNLETNCLTWTEQCKALFGLPTDGEMSYEIFLATLHPEDRQRTHDAVTQSIHDRADYDIEYRTCWPDGTIHWIEAKGSCTYDPVGNPIGMMGVALDITDRVQIERDRERILQQEQAARAAADRANQIKDEFLAVLSHELRSPLNPILGWIKLLQKGRLDQTRQQEALATIERNAKLQSQLIEDLLDISRIMRGKLTLTTNIISLTFVILAAVETVRLAAQAKNIQIILDLDSEVAPVRGDATRLQQVVWNLLTNAVKFTPNGGKVTVELRQLDQIAQLRVIDTGKGIHPEFLPYVFEYFRQQDSSTTRKFGGLGLGLAIVQQIVEMHGGIVTAESQGENLGAIFTVEFPVIQQVVSTTSQPVCTSFDIENSLSNLKILVVDDDKDTREFLAFLLEQSGATVTAVSSGFEALQVLEQFIPNVLVSDIGMAEMDGYMLCQQIRSRPIDQGGDMPALALTAYATEVDQYKALNVGFQAHLTKPVEPEELVRAIVKLLKDN